MCHSYESCHFLEKRMPLPIIIGAGVAALAANHIYREDLRKQDNQRQRGFKPNDAIGRYPCDALPSQYRSSLRVGSIACCEVYNGFYHAGLVVDDNAILELHGSGLSRIVSAQRFLQTRSGKRIYVASNISASALSFDIDEQRVSEEIYRYYDYHVTRTNCYFHTWYAITGETKRFASFEEFNNSISQLIGSAIYWDPIEEQGEKVPR